MSVRFGIASFAHHHANSWAAVADQARDVQLAGIWDDDPDRGMAAAQKYGTHFVATLEELAGDCDGVGVTTETANHLKAIRIIAETGAAVLCEKPLAADLEEARAIADVVNSTGITFMMNFPKRFDPATREVHRLIRDGRIGRPVFARVRHGHGHGFEQEFQGAWFQDPARSGGGTLIDEGIHAADLLRHLFGDPDSVIAEVSNVVLGLAVEDTAAATFRYANGLMAEIVTSWCMRAADSSVEVFGTEGTISLSGVDLASKGYATAPYLRFAASGEPWSSSSVIPGFLSESFHGQGPLRFFELLRDGGTPPVSLDDGIASLAMIRAAYEAAESGRRASL